MLKAAGTQVVGHECGLRKDELELMSFALDPGGAGFGTYANPVDACWGLERAIGLNSDFKAFGMQGFDESLIDLQEGLASGQHDILVRVSRRPERGDLFGERVGVLKLAAKRTVRADKVRIAKLADGSRPVFFASGPEITAGETTKDRGPSGAQSFALQRVKNFFDAIGH